MAVESVMYSLVQRAAGGLWRRGAGSYGSETSLANNNDMSKIRD